MFNIMLDKLPTEYEGYPINSDFRIGIQMFQALSDNELSDMEKICKACELLFDVEGVESFPDFTTMQKGMQWFLSDWYTDNTKKKDKEEHDDMDYDKEERKDMDYDIDQWRIYSAFLTQFGIDLNAVDMHFWVFMGLLSTLEECAFTRVVDIRTRKIDPKMKPSDKKALEKVKERYALGDVEDEQLTPQEQADYDAFMKYAKKGKENERRNM